MWPEWKNWIGFIHLSEVQRAELSMALAPPAIYVHVRGEIVGEWHDLEWDTLVSDFKCASAHTIGPAQMTSQYNSDYWTYIANYGRSVFKLSPWILARSLAHQTTRRMESIVEQTMIVKSEKKNKQTNRLNGQYARMHREWNGMCMHRHIQYIYIYFIFGDLKVINHDATTKAWMPTFRCVNVSSKRIVSTFVFNNFGRRHHCAFRSGRRHECRVQSHRVFILIWRGANRISRHSFSLVSCVFEKMHIVFSSANAKWAT